jgi:uncharacterized membrane protein
MDDKTLHQRHTEIRRRHEKLREEIKSHLNVQHSWVDSVADFLTVQFGTVWFFTLNGALFVLWITINSGLMPGVAPFDQYPFNFLTMVVSLEAIFLSIIVLISQNRQGHIADVRERIDFEINVRDEEETTKLLVMVEQIAHQLKVPLAIDPELENMEKRTDIEKIRARIEEDQ